MPRPGRRSVGWALGVLVGVALIVTGCGDGTGDENSTTAGGAGGDPVEAPEPASGDGLAVRIGGQVNGDLLCPGGRRPCLPFEGSVEPAGDGSVWVSGRIVDGVLVVDDQQPIPDRLIRDYSNRCPDQDLAGAPPPETLEAMHENLAARPPGYADLWDSDDGVLHIAVAGDDPGPAEAFLAEAGLADQVCLVTGFPLPDDVLEAVQGSVADAARAAGYDGYGVGRDAWDGTVTIDLPRFDEGFRAELDRISAENEGVPIIALAGVEVIDGSLADYEAAVASIAVTPDAAQQLTAQCGAVVFSSIPPDLDEFPPLDDDAQAALDGLIEGPAGVEAGGFAPDFEWSIAARTDDELVLFGQRPGGGESPWANVRFERRDEAWWPTGFGGCWIEIVAPGLGPASVGLDPDQPPDPAATELPLLINEQACANGRAPVDREIVPVVTETDESVSIVVLVAPVEGGANCPGNPWHPITVTLDAPLGDRELLDGHHHPPEPVAPVDVQDG